MSACAQCLSCEGYVIGICCSKKRCSNSSQAGVNTVNGRVKFCHDFQNTGCRRRDCKYVHANKEEECLFFKAGVIPSVMMDRCAVAPVYSVGYNPRVWYMGQYPQFNSQVGFNWAPPVGGPVMPPPPRAPPPPLPPPQMPPPMLRPPMGPVYYAAPPVNVLADPRVPMSRPISEPLHIDIPGQDATAMSTDNPILLCTLDELPYLCLCNFHRSMVLSRPQPPHIYELLRNNAALY